MAVLTGPIRTGKTTALVRAFRRDGRGIVQPVIDGRRHVMELTSGRTHPLEAAPDTPVEHRVPVGSFVFDGKVFAWAGDCLGEAMQDAHPNAWIVLDEVGPLELAGQGLAPAVAALVAYAEAGSNVLLVVREGLVEAVASSFHLRQPSILRLGDTLPGGPRLGSP